MGCYSFSGSPHHHSHKELRFLFPIVVLVPLFLILAWQDNLTAKLKKGFTNLLIVPNNAITGSRTLTLLKKLHFALVYPSISPIDQKIIKFYDVSSNKNNLIVYEYKK